MTDHDPLTDPQPGDSVRAYLRGHWITRTIKKRVETRYYAGADLEYTEISRVAGWQLTCVRSWRKWCKKNNAEVITPEK